MKKINTSNVSSTSRQPLLGRSITHLTESLMEGFNAYAQGLLAGYYSASEVYILFGCVNSGASSGAGLAFNVSAGAVFYNGEYYVVDAFAGTFSGTNVIVGSVVTTYQAGDPVTMTDGTTKNVHEIRKFVLSQGASGSGTKNHTAFKQPFLTKYVNSVIDDSNTFTINFANYPAYALMTGFTFTTPNDGKTRNLKIDFKAHCFSDGTSNANGALGSARLRNTTAGTTLDFEEYRMSSPATNNGSSNSLCMSYYGAVAPNTTIRVELQGYSGHNDVRFSFSKLFVEEKTIL